MPFQFRGSAVDLANVIIESERLRLLSLTERYTESIFESFTPDITRYMLPKAPESLSETEAFVASAIDGFERGTDLHLVIIGRATSEFFGVCGLHDREEPELGIWLKKPAHGLGYGREAIAALIDWATQHLIFDYLIYPVDRRNTPSLKIPESLGGKVIGERTERSQSGVELDELVYALGRDSRNGI